MLTRDEIEAGLPQFTGTTQWYPMYPGILLTDGTHWLAESAGCYWLYDIIWSIRKPILDKDWFAAVKLVVTGSEADVTVEDGNSNVLYIQHIECTDFPLPEITLFVADAEGGTKVIILPSEYWRSLRYAPRTTLPVVLLS